MIPVYALIPVYCRVGDAPNGTENSSPSTQIHNLLRRDSSEPKRDTHSGSGGLDYWAKNGAADGD